MHAQYRTEGIRELTAYTLFIAAEETSHMTDALTRRTESVNLKKSASDVSFFSD